MAALWNRAWPLYFHPVVSSSSFYLSFFPRLFSSVAHRCLPYFHTWCGLSVNFGCRSETCCARLAENTGRKKSLKIRNLATIAQLCWAITSQLRHVWTIRKNLLNSNISHMSSHYGELRPTNGWDRFVSLEHPSKFQRVSRLGFASDTAIFVLKRDVKLQPTNFSDVA